MPTRARAARFFIATLLALASCVLAACSSVQTVGQESNAQLATTYDPQNNRLTLTDSAGDLTRYTYDHANRLTSVAAPAIGTTEYQYNTASQLIERTGQGGYSSVTAYDPAGRVQRIEHRIGGTPTLTLEYDYDRNGNRAEQRLTHAGSGLERTTYAYDNADRLTRSTRTPPTGNALETTWTLDAVGNRTLEEVRELGSLTQRTAYSYDLRDRLQTATPELPTGPPTAYQYDADGNVSSEQIGSAAPTQYRWDARDRLSEYTPAGAPAIRNRYDESDRRIAREDAATGSRYRWDGNAVIEETNALGNRLTRYHRGIGLIGATSATTQPDPRQYASDAQDTPLALIRPDGGIAGRASFDIWGKTTSQSGEQSKLGFTGYQKETGDLYQAVARYYRPGTGSFLSTDPWEGDYNNPVSLNKYLYGYGNPGIFVDPDGRCAEPATAVLCASAIAIAAGWAYNYIENSFSDNQELRESPAYYATTNTADQAVTIVGAGLTAVVVVETGGTAALVLGGARQTGLAGVNAAIAANAPRVYGAVEGSIALGVGITTGAELPQIVPTYYPRTILAANSTVLDDELRAMQPVIRQSEIPAASSVRYEIVEDAGEAGVATDRRGSTLEVLDCCARCFGAGTLVMTADGLRPIESVSAGQRVMARDEETGQTALRTVQHVIVRDDREVFDLTFANGGKREVISVTADHRFHTVERGWVVSGELQIGEAIESLDGRRLVFESRSAQSRKAPTFNLSVTEDHNYFVGESGLWVHNCTPCGDATARPWKGTPEGDAWRYERYVSEGGQRSFSDWYRVSRGGRSGGENHQQIQFGLSYLDYETEVQFGNRFADAARPGEIHQIGGRNKRGDPIKREREAIQEIIDSEEYRGETIYFWDKTDPSRDPIINPQLEANWGSLDDDDG